MKSIEDLINQIKNINDYTDQKAVRNIQQRSKFFRCLGSPEAQQLNKELINNNL